MRTHLPYHAAPADVGHLRPRPMSPLRAAATHLLFKRPVWLLWSSSRPRSATGSRCSYSGDAYSRPPGIRQTPMQGATSNRTGSAKPVKPGPPPSSWSLGLDDSDGRGMGSRRIRPPACYTTTAMTSRRTYSIGRRSRAKRTCQHQLIQGCTRCRRRPSPTTPITT